MSEHEPVNPDTSPAARHLLRRLHEISGARTLSGQHNTPRELSLYSDQAEQITGHYPAVWGQDFGFAPDGDMDGTNFRADVVAEARRQHARGSIITLMWHAVRPTEEEPVTFEGSICRGLLDPEDWTDLLTGGTSVHQRWIRQVDVIAGLLTELRDADIPVLWRPYHEMNGDWFWWCSRPGPTGYEALYRALFDRFTRHHGLNNLLWVWNANAPRDNVLPYEACYPGHDVVDILAADVYHNDYRQSHHDDLVRLADGRPTALGEVGVLPTPAVLDQQPRWCWFMTWSTFLTHTDNEQCVKALFDDPRVLHRS